MKTHVSQLIHQLDFDLDDMCEGGLSTGQKQMICLGRALLRNTKIFVMDEATASLDFHTDQLLKQTIRACFSGKTLLVIAHRLDSIMDSDRILVFEQGKIVEEGHPTSLLSHHHHHHHPHGIFKSLVDAATSHQL
eukprot:TRINITY_DN4573_c0_g1_i1.p1 TRINITY_DN4573_c0_g1~~TRINITY_DN4573_c0_g1_i1.p1  ORF type:complete len:135 (-),score=35.74 TRINITY_DN4573_c0_g1_i1:9-413(-)